MKYGWDKIKVVTDWLNLWDKLEALWFDRCWYLLIWKWNNSYWTKWDPLMSSETPCWEEANCPMCQPIIDDVADLPWRPNPCDDWDAFIMMSRTWKLKVLCKSQFDDNDRKVAVSDWDEIAWHLKDKLIVCDDDWPLSFTENEDGSFHTYCLGWDPSKAKMKFIDLIDTPDDYCNPWLLYSDWSKITCMTPDMCDWSDYWYVVYDSRAKAFKTTCESWLSYAFWQFEWWSVNVPMRTEWIRIYATNHNESISWWLKFNWVWHLRSTNDIVAWTWSILFQLTKPWIYMITCNSTLRNETEAWLQAARWWLLIVTWAWWEIEWTDFKYDSRWYTEYVNDFYPNQPEQEYLDTSSWVSERNLELSIMSFNTTHTIVVEAASANSPVWVWFWVRCSTYLHDHRMYPADESSVELDSVVLSLTWWETTIWPKTTITCARISSVPNTYKSRF